MLFGVKKPWLRPSIKYLRRSVALRIFNLGILFFVLQIAMALAYTSDNVIAAQVLGPEAVAQYSIPMRMFSIPPMILTMALSALWPAYGEAINRGDVVWIKQTLLRSLIITALFTGLLSLPMIGFGSQIIRLWVGPTIRPPFLLLLGFGVWMIVGSLGNAVAMFFNGLHIVRFQVYTALSMAVSNLLLSVYLAQRIGLPGIIWGTVVTYTVFSVIPTIIYLPRFLRDMCKDKNISYDC
jgi:O-antigen/teichoic acid export membrane protein